VHSHAPNFAFAVVTFYIFAIGAVGCVQVFGVKDIGEFGHAIALNCVTLNTLELEIVVPYDAFAGGVGGMGKGREVNYAFGQNRRRQ
jgi:hypothetical protein